MIYEKRSCEAKRVKAEDFSHSAFVNEKNAQISVYNKDEIITCDAEQIHGKRIKKRKRALSRRVRKSSGTAKIMPIVAAAFLICAFILDARVFDGRFKKQMYYLAQKGLHMAAEHVSEETPLKTAEARTLYTIDYYDGLETENGAANIMAGDSVEKDLEKDSESTLPVNSAGGGSYVDGVKFLPITSQNLSTDNPYSIINQTSFTPDMESIASTKPSSLDGLEISDDPLVLIVHTHACESYTQYEEMYPENEETRSEDTDKNIVRVGGEITRTLSEFGIPAVHCTELHDKDSFINAYTNSANSVKEYLKQYPSIRFVIDVHRDAVIRDDGESIKALSNIAGEDYAQLMLVVGTNGLGHNHPDWQDNLSLAVTLQRSILDTYPSLCRSINLRNVPFNQQLSDGYLLLEVGTCGNTIDEALRSARAFGENLARVIMNA